MLQTIYPAEFSTQGTVAFEYLLDYREALDDNDLESMQSLLLEHENALIEILMSSRTKEEDVQILLMANA